MMDHWRSRTLEDAQLNHWGIDVFSKKCWKVEPMTHPCMVIFYLQWLMFMVSWVFNVGKYTVRPMSWFIPVPWFLGKV